MENQLLWEREGLALASVVVYLCGELFNNVKQLYICKELRIIEGHDNSNDGSVGSV
jgi:hypothetical protein